MSKKKKAKKKDLANRLQTWLTLVCQFVASADGTVKLVEALMKLVH